MLGLFLNFVAARSIQCVQWESQSARCWLSRFIYLRICRIHCWRAAREWSSEKAATNEHSFACRSCASDGDCRCLFSGPKALIFQSFIGPHRHEILLFFKRNNPLIAIAVKIRKLWHYLMRHIMRRGVFLKILSRRQTSDAWLASCFWGRRAAIKWQSMNLKRMWFRDGQFFLRITQRWLFFCAADS